MQENKNNKVPFKQKGLKPISAVKRADLAKQKIVKAKLMAECPVDTLGHYVCPRCFKSPDYRGLQLAHKKSLAQGGRTSIKNCEISCSPCHNGPKGHRVEGVPNPKTDKVDRTPECMWRGGRRPFSKAEAAGRPAKKEKKS